MKEGLKEALAKLAEVRKAQLASEGPKGHPTESGEAEAGTVRIGDEVKHLREPRAVV